ncbi:MAG: heme-binding domain-containing protein [Bacteroidetes Order II. Incertae sedis bacterium]|nr:heme-binding domain-containing protein [Bacteroidetes Order II. bacterium]
MVKKTVTVLLAILVVIQFIRPTKNDTGDERKSISTQFPVSANVQTILRAACNDCHSNKTTYPWYSNLQPLGWWLADHVNEGKRGLNFSVFASYRPAKQFHKLEEISEVLEKGEMPLDSYTWIHKDAVLDNVQKKALIDWAESLRSTLKERFPADSLRLKRRPRTTAPR